MLPHLMFRNNMKTAFIIACIFLFIFSMPSFAGWERTYGGSRVDYASCVAQTSDGGYIVTGYTYSFSPDSTTDVYVLKLDAFGDTVWTRTYGGSYCDCGNSIAQTSDGGYIIAGLTESFGVEPGWYDVYVLKLNAIGDTIWTRIYNNGDWDFGRSVSPTSDDGYIIAGWTSSYGSDTSFSNIYVLKLNSYGDTIWTRTYSGNGNSDGYSILCTHGGGYIVAGNTHSIDGDAQVFILKLDVLGDTIWTRTYGGDDDDLGYSIALTSNGDYVIAGMTGIFGTGIWDVYVLKLDAFGDIIWTRTYGGSFSDVGHSVSSTFNGGCIVAGNTNSFGAGERDVYVLKLDTFGDTIWTRTYGGENVDRGYSISYTSDSGCIVAGLTESFGAGLSDIYLIKTDSLGYTDIEEPFEFKPEDISISIYPNPFNSSCHISVSADAIVQIFDLNGKCIRAFDKTPCMWIPDEKITSGIYLIRATIGDQTITKRTILLK